MNKQTRNDILKYMYGQPNREYLMSDLYSEFDINKRILMENKSSLVCDGYIENTRRVYSGNGGQRKAFVLTDKGKDYIKNLLDSESTNDPQDKLLHDACLKFVKHMIYPSTRSYPMKPKDGQSRLILDGSIINKLHSIGVWDDTIEETIKDSLNKLYNNMLDIKTDELIKARNDIDAQIKTFTDMKMGLI